MNERDTSGPAFPIADPFAVKGPKNEAEALRLQSGMTLRDYFAIRAFQTRLAKYNDWTLTELTEQSYADADAMLEARKK
jgi:hypothetical protein